MKGEHQKNPGGSVELAISTTHSPGLTGMSPVDPMPRAVLLSPTNPCWYRRVVWLGGGKGELVEPFANSF